ncbi:MAG: 50S ribosomal protein L9 [Clostridiales bacterium]|nr:50S ribosomal protein L9 [Clostridiales bacterium]
MKVILLADIKGKGKKDQVIEVPDGYARNYLLPKKLAVIADAKAMNEAKNKEESRLHRLEVEKKEATDLAARLSSITIKITAQAGTDGRLYGSVTSKDIAEELKRAHGIELDKRKIVIPAPLKAFGTYTIEAKIYPEITGKFTLILSDK